MLVLGYARTSARQGTRKLFFLHRQELLGQALYGSVLKSAKTHLTVLSTKYFL